MNDQKEYRQEGRSDSEFEKNLMSGQDIEKQTALGLAKLLTRLDCKYSVVSQKMINSKYHGIYNGSIVNEGDCEFVFIDGAKILTCVVEIKTNPMNLKSELVSKNPNNKGELRTILKIDSLQNCINNKRSMLLCRKDFYGKFYLYAFDHKDLDNLYKRAILKNKVHPYNYFSRSSNCNKPALELFHADFNFIETKKMTKIEAEKLIEKMLQI